MLSPTAMAGREGTRRSPLAGATPTRTSSCCVPTAPAAKMNRNALTGQVLTFVRMGIAGAPEVQAFVGELGRLDPDFAERLKAGFVKLYRELRQQGHDGDSLFLALIEKVGGGSSNFRLRAAALAVIGYLFLTCEVFEP